MSEPRSRPSRTRRLHLLRHAKSDWADAALADRDRPLSARGRRALPLIAAWLAADELSLDLVLCSTATRARETVAGAVAALPTAPRVVYDEALYAAAAGDLLARLQRLPAAARSVLVCGHNPGMHELASALADDIGTPLHEKLPTGGVVTFVVDGSWRNLSPATCVLSSFVTPKSLRATAVER